MIPVPAAAVKNINIAAEGRERHGLLFLRGTAARFFRKEQAKWQRRSVLWQVSSVCFTI